MTDELALAPVAPPHSSVPANPLAAVLSDPARLAELDTDKLKMLLDMHRELEADEARRAFNRAFNAFKAAAPRIVKNRHVEYAGYWHVTLDRAVGALTPALAEHGLSHSWAVAQNEGAVEVTTTLRHVQGHSETFTVSAPPDTSGKKNSTQAIKSTITYLQRAGLFGILGLAEANADDDGAGGAEPVEVISESQIADFEGMLDELSEDRQRRVRSFVEKRFGAVENIAADKFGELVRWAKGNGNGGG